MSSSFPEDLLLRRKWTFHAHETQIVVEKRALEKTEHVLMKAFLWALYFPKYPNVLIEKSIGGRYKPDVIALNESNQPIFWAEAGQVRGRKIHDILKKNKSVHLAIAKWNFRMEPFKKNILHSLKGTGKSGPVDLLIFPEDSLQRFVDPDGNLLITRDDIDFLRL